MPIQYHESQASCNHPALIHLGKSTGQSVPAPCKMKECRCGKNCFCELCGAGRISYPCICDKYQEILDDA